MSWMVEPTLFGDIHIHPLNDLKLHDFYEDDCWCNPSVDIKKGIAIVTHHSADWRELDEEYLSLWLDKPGPLSAPQAT